MISEKQESKAYKPCYSIDHSVTIFFLFQIAIHIVLFVKYQNKLLFPIITCSINGCFILQYILIPKTKAISYKNICIIISKLLTLTLIFLIDLDLTILIIAVLERLDLVLSDKNALKKFENLILRIFSLFIIFIHFDILLTIILFYSLLIELNKLLLLNRKENNIQYINSNITYQNTNFYSDNIWGQRFKNMPQCFIIINLKTLKITYKNTFVYQFFKQCYENEEQLDQIILQKLQFSLLHAKIEKIKQLVSQPKISQNQIKKKNMWSYKSDSISLQMSPVQKQQFDHSKGTESLDFVSSTQQYNLTDLIQNLKAQNFIDLQLQNYIEIFADQTQQSITSNYHYSFSPKKLQLLGQLMLFESENEIFVSLQDISKQNELQELISNTEFKQKLVESFSHELRTPLNSAINFLTSCSIDEDSSEYIKQNYITPALNSLKLQSFIISDIIDLSQISTNNLYCQYREFSVREFVNEISSIFKISFEMKDIEFDLNLVECSTTTIVTDYQRLIQIIVNLLQNSLKFSSKGIVVLQLTTVNNGIKFQVSDSGLGIESEQLYQLQLLLQSIEQYKDIQINKTWQGFGLLISAILVNKLSPKEQKFLHINSQGLYQGTEVWFTIENHNNKNDQNRQNTLRQSSSRFQNSHNDDQFADINGLIYQAAEQNSIFSKTFKQTKLKTMKTGKLQNEYHRTDSQSFESLQQKYGQLSPLSPSLITDKLFQANKFTTKLQTLKTINIKKIFEAEIKDDLEHLQQFQKKKKCTCQNILSVDDEIFNQRSIQMLLGKLGFEVVIAFNGEEALQKVKEAEPCSKQCQLFNLILMDYQMPIMDGCQATAKLIEMMNQKIIPKIHIIGLTAFTNASDIKNCLKHGMSDVLAKPLNLKEFKQILALI